MRPRIRSKNLVFVPFLKVCMNLIILSRSLTSNAPKNGFVGWKIYISPFCSKILHFCESKSPTDALVLLSKPNIRARDLMMKFCILSICERWYGKCGEDARIICVRKVVAQCLGHYKHSANISFPYFYYLHILLLLEWFRNSKFWWRKAVPGWFWRMEGIVREKYANVFLYQNWIWPPNVLGWQVSCSICCLSLFFYFFNS